VLADNLLRAAQLTGQLTVAVSAVKLRERVGITPGSRERRLIISPGLSDRAHYIEACANPPSVTTDAESAICSRVPARETNTTRSPRSTSRQLSFSAEQVMTGSSTTAGSR
jgi:hypothetical protein